MRIESTEFSEVKKIYCVNANDYRGRFVKTFNEDKFKDCGLDVIFRESYYSVSHKDVIRGMHFQLPPFEHEKLVHVIQGKVLDVILDIRKNSVNYKKCMGIYLDAEQPCSIYIPKGFAHGFKSLEDNTIMLYQVSTVYKPEYDSGIAYDTIGFSWEIDNPIISERDKGFISLCEFESPF